MDLVKQSESATLILTSEIPLDRHPVTVYLASLSRGSRRSMLQALNTIASMLARNHDAMGLAWWELRYQHIAAARAQLAEVYAPATANKMLAALRGVLRESWRLGLIHESAYRRATDIPGVRGSALPMGRALKQGEIAALLDSCSQDPSTAGARDAAIISVLYACGLRRSEICRLETTDLVNGELRIRKAKGAKDRVVPLAQGAEAAVVDWLDARGTSIGPLFVPIDKAGRLGSRLLSSQAIYNILNKRRTQAGVDHFTPHDLRRTLISHLLEVGVDLVTVSAIAGHASVTTTARYDRRGERAKHKAVGQLHVPYKGRKARCRD